MRKFSVTIDIALGTSAERWANMQTRYDLLSAKHQTQSTIQRISTHV